MLKISVYSYSCANLIHSYVLENAEMYAELYDTEKITELEFVLRDFACFRDWAEAYGYIVLKDD